MHRTTTQELINSVADAAENAALINEPLTADYVAYWCGVSQTHAARMIQYWQGAGSPIGTE